MKQAKTRNTCIIINAMKYSGIKKTKSCVNILGIISNVNDFGGKIKYCHVVMKKSSTYQPCQKRRKGI